MPACLTLALLGCATPPASPSMAPSAPATAAATSGARATQSPPNPPSGTPRPSHSDEPPPSRWAPALSVGEGSARTVGSHIAAGRAGFLAALTDWIPTQSPGPGNAEYSLWHSTDGFGWTEIAFPTDGANLRIAALYAASDGSYVLHGQRTTGEAPYFDTFALRSDDGSTWKEVVTGLPSVIYIQAVESGPAGQLLVGGQGAETNPTLWLSTDGLTWELVHEFEQDTHWVQIHDADGGQEGYVVIGRRIEPEGPYRRFAFASADGREWFNVDEPFGPDNQGFVFEANVSSLGPDWVATLGHPDAPTAIWLSANGLDWEEVASVEHGPSTIAALLEEVNGTLLFSPGSGVWEGTAGVWSSPDGITWTEEDFGGEPVWLGGVEEGSGVIAATGTVPNEDFTSTGGIWVRTSD